MSLTQRIITSIVPRSWAESMEAESRKWMIRCQCGHGKSVWEVGGIRWKAAGNPRKYGRCSACGSSSWMRMTKESD